MTRFNDRAVFKGFLALTDTALLAVAFLVAYWVRFHVPLFPPPPLADSGTYLRFGFLIAFVGFLTLYTSGLYRLHQPFFGIDDFFAVIKASTLAHLIGAAVSFGIRGKIPGDAMETISRIVLVQSWLFSIVVLTFWRLGADGILGAFRRRGMGLAKVLLVGEGAFSASFARLLKENPELGYQPVRHLESVDPEMLAEALGETPAEEVMVTSDEIAPQEVIGLMNVCQQSGARISMVPNLFHVLTSRIQVREVAGVPIFALDERIFLRSSRILKRSIDLVLAAVTLIVLAPVMGLVALLIRLESRGPIIWRQVRVGKRARPFTVLKFRSMYADAEQRRADLEVHNEAEGPLFKMREDPRVTRVGRVIRKLSIDELPQMVNVFRGDMSIVGPRPALPSEVDQYESWQRKRFEVLPGLTGLAQINGRSDLGFDETLRFDFYYIENWSPLVDLKIMLKTIPKVLLAKGAY